MGWGVFKWISLFCLEAVGLFMASKSETGVAVTSFDDLKIVVSKMSEMQGEIGLVMKVCLVAVVVIVALQLVYLLARGIKSCCFTTVKGAVTDALP